MKKLIKNAKDKYELEKIAKKIQEIKKWIKNNYSRNLKKKQFNGKEKIQN